MKKRKDGRYQKKVTLPDGRQKMVYGKSQGEIKQKAQDLLQEYQSGLVIGDDTTVGEWTVQWFATYKGNLRKVTRENYAILYLTEQLAAQLKNDIARYQDAVTPAIILIPGKEGSLGIGMANVKSAVERAVGADIL